MSNQAISTSDLALLSAFYVLASSDRSRIRRVLLDRATFKNQLDDSQGWIVDLVRAYVDANYEQVMSLLQYSEVCPFFPSPFFFSLVGNLRFSCPRCFSQFFSLIPSSRPAPAPSSHVFRPVPSSNMSNHSRPSAFRL